MSDTEAVALSQRAAHLSPEVMEMLNKPTVHVEEAGRLMFGVGRLASYAAARKGQIPTIKIGRKLFVPTYRLREMLGLPPHALTAIAA